MRNLCFILLFFICTYSQYSQAVCTYNTGLVYSAQKLNIINGTGNTVMTDINNQVVNGCNSDKPPDSFPYLRSNFKPGALTLIDATDFRINESAITINNPGSTNSQDIADAKLFIANNLTFNFSLAPNAGSHPYTTITSSENLVNIIPSTLDIAAVNNVSDEKYYMKDTWDSVGIRATASFSFSATEASAKVRTVLGNTNTSIDIVIGTFEHSLLFGTSATTSFTPLGNHTTTSRDVTFKIPIQYTPATCSISVPSTLNLGTTTAANINENVFSNTKDIDININCSNSMVNRTINVTVADSSNTTNNTGVLANIAPAGSRSNAVVRLKDSTNNPLKIGQPFIFSPTANDSTNKTWSGNVQAELYKPDTAAITLGLVQAQATFTMTYD